MIRQLPIYIYEPDGSRRAIGIIEVTDGVITGRIVEKQVIKQIEGLHNGAFSISPEPMNGRS